MTEQLGLGRLLEEAAVPDEEAEARVWEVAGHESLVVLVAGVDSAAWLEEGHEGAAAVDGVFGPPS